MFTQYDEKRLELKHMLKECLEFTKENIMNEDIKGYEDMRNYYDIDVYRSIKAAIDTIGGID